MTNKELEMKLLLLGWKLRVEKYSSLVQVSSANKVVKIPESRVSTWKPRIIYNCYKDLHCYTIW